MKKIKKTERHSLENIQSTTSTSGVEIEDKEGYIKEQLYFTDIFDDAKFKKFIKAIESAIRTSDAYKSFIAACMDKGLDRCAVLGNVQRSDKVTVEIHHYPFTLYDIVYLCVMRHLKLGHKITSMLITEEVLRDHIYERIICVTPLCKSVHKLVHAGEIFIPYTSVYGDLQGFLDKYGEELTPEMKNLFNKIKEMTEAGITYSDSDILKKINTHEKNVEKDYYEEDDEELSEDEEKYVDDTDEEEEYEDDSESEDEDDSIEEEDDDETEFETDEEEDEEESEDEEEYYEEDDDVDFEDE